MTFQAELEEKKVKEFAEFYQISVGTTNYYYTTFEYEVDFLGETYTPAIIERSDFPQEKTLKPVELKIKIQLLDYIKQYIANAPVETTYIDIYRVFIHDTNKFRRIFSGKVTGVIIAKEASEISCESADIIHKVKLPRWSYLSYCNNALFDNNCGLDKFSWRVYCENITFPEAQKIQAVKIGFYAQDYFSIGYVETLYQDARFITQHQTDEITIQAPFDNRLQPGAKVWVYPGCDGSPETCKNRFNNFANFKGFPYIPSSNPVFWGIK